MKQRIPVWRKDQKLQRLSDLHIYTASWEPLTAFHDPYNGKIVRHFKPRRVVRCHECRDWRWASKLKVQAYGDGLRIKCADGCYGERGE